MSVVRIVAGIRFRALSPSRFISESVGSFNSRIEIRYIDQVWIVRDEATGHLREFHSFKSVTVWMGQIVQAKEQADGVT